MSVLPPKADIALHRSGCPLCAKSRHSAPQYRTPLFDHLVGAHKQRRRYCEAEGFGSLEVQYCFVLSGRFHRKVSRFGAAKDAVDIRPRLAKHVDEVDAIGHQPTSHDKESERKNRGQLMPDRKLDDQIAMDDHRGIRWYHEAAVRQLTERLDGALNVISFFNRTGHKLDPE